MMSKLELLKNIVDKEKKFFFNGKKAQFIGPHVEIVFAIGDDNVAYLNMTKEAYDILISPEVVK
jgi:hypothetical protein